MENQRIGTKKDESLIEVVFQKLVRTMKEMSHVQDLQEQRIARLENALRRALILHQDIN